MGDFDTFEDSPYYGELVDHVSREAVENFTALRLCALYDKEPAIRLREQGDGRPVVGRARRVEMATGG